MSSECVFVAGGTGRVGRRVVHLLAARLGRRVAVWTRDPGSPAAAALLAALGQEQVQLIEGDLRAKDAEAALRSAIERCGASAVVCCAAGSPRAVDAAGTARLARAAAAAAGGGRPLVGRFVLVSSAGVTQRWMRLALDVSLVGYASAKRSAEAAVRAAFADRAYVIVRPTWLTDDAPPLDPPSALVPSQGDRISVLRTRVPRALVAAVVAAAAVGAGNAAALGGITLELHLDRALEASGNPNEVPFTDAFWAGLVVDG